MNISDILGFIFGCLLIPLNSPVLFTDSFEQPRAQKLKSRPYGQKFLSSFYEAQH
jgi:hypothetical protein